MEQKKREPSQITQGETVQFIRHLPDYPATDGWSLLYAMRGNGQDIEFTSVASDDDHSVTVDAAVTALWLPADYELQGFVVNTDGTKTQFYLAPVTVLPNLATAAPDLDVRTHAQKMLSSIEAELEQLAQSSILSSTVEGTTIMRERRTELLMLRQKYTQERRGEVAAARAKAGLPTGRKIKTVLAVMPPGPVEGQQFGAGNSIFNTQWP